MAKGRRQTPNKVASAKRCHNSILALQINGYWIQELSIVKEEIVNFYSEIYGEDLVHRLLLGRLDFDHIFI